MNITGKKIKYFISGLSICMLFLLACTNVAAQSAGLSADLFDGILSGMGGDIEFDDMISAMEGKNSSKNDIDFDLLSRSMTREGNSYTANMDSRVISGALDYLDNIYNSYPGMNGYGNSSMLNGSAYRAAIPGSAVLPVNGRITSRFGYRPSFGRMHKGVDVSLQIGDTVVAAMDGYVERVSVDPKGYGLFVCLQHPNGMETRYAHLSKSLVSAGMNVNAGEPIALGGNTGNSTGPHLHFETRVNGTALDPTTMFDFTNPGNFTRTRRSLADLDVMANNQSNGGMYTDNSSTATNNAARMPQRKTYVVRAGDTVGSIAHKNGISILSLCRLNMLSTNESLQPGRMLKLR